MQDYFIVFMRRCVRTSQAVPFQILQMNCFASGLELNVALSVSPGQYILSSVLGSIEISLALSSKLHIKNYYCH